MKRNFRRSQPDANSGQAEQPAAPPQMQAAASIEQVTFPSPFGMSSYSKETTP